MCWWCCSKTTSRRHKSAGGGEKPLWTISVPKSDAIRAWRLMKSQDLPRAAEKGFADTFGTNSLIPTATEEKALYLDALCNELQKTIETIDGVVKARVHLVLPEAEILPEEGNAGESTQGLRADQIRLNSRGEFRSRRLRSGCLCPMRFRNSIPRCGHYRSGSSRHERCKLRSNVCPVWPDQGGNRLRNGFQNDRRRCAFVYRVPLPSGWSCRPEGPAACEAR